MSLKSAGGEFEPSSLAPTYITATFDAVFVILTLAFESSIILNECVSNCKLLALLKMKSAHEDAGAGTRHATSFLNNSTLTLPKLAIVPLENLLSKFFITIVKFVSLANRVSSSVRVLGALPAANAFIETLEPCNRGMLTSLFSALKSNVHKTLLPVG